MTTWTDQISSHPIWGELEQTGPSIDQALNHATDNADVTDSLLRLKAVIAFIGKRLEITDSYLC